MEEIAQTEPSQIMCRPRFFVRSKNWQPRRGVFHSGGFIFNFFCQPHFSSQTGGGGSWFGRKKWNSSRGNIISEGTLWFCGKSFFSVGVYPKSQIEKKAERNVRKFEKGDRIPKLGPKRWNKEGTAKIMPSGKYSGYLNKGDQINPEELHERQIAPS